MITLTSPNGRAVCTISPDAGGRIESIVVGHAVESEVADTELLITRDSPEADLADPYSWGCFIMAPFCGRVRHGVLSVGGQLHRLEKRSEPHAMHGTVVDRSWVVLKVTSTSALLGCDLGSQWPFAGMVHHEVTISDSGLSMDLTLSAHHPMPAQIGWHPWFRRPDEYSLPFTAHLERDADGIATSRVIDLVEPARGSYDDCFTGATGPIAVRIGDVSLSLDSNCTHWTVFDQRHHGICFEPQSGPPNGINDCPDMVAADERLTRWFSIRWHTGTVD